MLEKEYQKYFPKFLIKPNLKQIKNMSWKVADLKPIVNFQFTEFVKFFASFDMVKIIL